MKLFSRYNRVNIIAMIAVVMIGSICYYFIIRFILIDQLDSTLRVEEAEILAFVKEKDSLPPATNYKDQVIVFSEAKSPVRRRFFDISLVDSSGHESDPYRRLVFPVTVNGKVHEASVTKSELETEDLLLMMVLITIGVIILLLLILFMANRFLLRTIWQPFYDTLENVRQFNISGRKAIAAKASDITEFQELGNALNQMTQKMMRDYESIRNFADNASHEMQTPLAIINSKLDLMIQDHELNERQMRPMQDMYDAIRRLSKLNQSLLLLTKIENKQFIKADQVQVKKLINHKLAQLEEFIHAKNITVTTSLLPVVIAMSDYLADILLNNLLSNAINHTPNGGKIDIHLGKHSLEISNSGIALPFDPADLFERFKKSNYSEGMGLGLAIVKQICDSSQYRITYAFHDDKHHFTVFF